MRVKLDQDMMIETTGYEIMIHFDGSCNPNPGGLGSYGFHIEKLDDVGWVGCDKIGRNPGMTNNVAEWSGLRAALKSILANRGTENELGGDKLLIFGDSQIVIRQLTGKWKVKAQHLQTFKNDCLKLLTAIGLPWEAKWVRRNLNARADALAEQARQGYMSRPAIIGT